MRTRILGPLGMTETVLEGPELRGKVNVTRPHEYVGDTLRALPALSQELVDAIAPAGSMYSNVLDMSKWMRFLLDSGRVAGKRLVSDTAFAELMRPQVLVPSGEFYPTAKLTHPSFTAYGMAWFLEDYRGEKIVFHTGSIDGLVAIVGLMPARRLGIVVVANRDHAEVRHALMYRVFDAYLGGPERDWNTEIRALYQKARDSVKVAKKEADAKRVLGTKPSLSLDRYAGAYADSLYGSVTVRLERGRLVLAPSAFLTADLEHWNTTRFAPGTATGGSALGGDLPPRPRWQCLRRGPRRGRGAGTRAGCAELLEAHVLNRIRSPVAVVEMPPFLRIHREPLGLHRSAEQGAQPALLGRSAGVIGVGTG